MKKVFIVSLMVLVLGCEKEKTSPPQPIAVPEAVQKGASSDSVASPEVLEYHYTSDDKPDPFQPLLVERKRKEGEALLTPLQQYDLSQLVLVGVVSGIAEPRAMLEDPDGKGYIVQIGTGVGKSGGKVAEVGSDWIKVVEEYNDPLGRVRTHEEIIKLRKEEGEE
ncbi:MAG: pilus assembly protein PilP [Deltaproteobacteria bacterium]|nr:pilus assembly protein PilP [Deltaproteobacteria bacterium]